MTLLRESQSRFENEGLVFVEELTAAPESIPERKVLKLKQYLMKRDHSGKNNSLRDVRQIIALLQEVLPYFKKQEQAEYKKVYARMKDEERVMTKTKTTLEKPKATEKKTKKK